MISFEMSDEAVLRELGARLKRERLNQNVSQQELAEKSGLGRKTITCLENGHGSSMASFIAVLRALNILDQLDAFLPKPGLSPIELSKLKGYERQRASGIRGMNVAEEDEKYGWEWGE